MKFTWRALLAFLFNILAMVGWCYVGAWMIWTRPVRGLIAAQLAGELSLWKVILAFAQGFLYLSLAGAVWCVCYILSNHFKED